jgi:uncharacterized protein with HEPN domain
MLEAIEKVFLYSEDLDNADDFFDANEQMNFNACQTLLLAIGEESKKIEAKLKERYTDTPWELVAGFRNRLAHDYRGVDPEITYEIIQDYLPALKSVLLKMLKLVEYDDSVFEEALKSKYYNHLKYLNGH